MPTLISKQVYDETIELIKGNKKPDPVLKGMQEFYASYGIRLYNLYTDNLYGGIRVMALTNVVEGYSRTKPELENFGEDSLKEYARLCEIHGVDISNLHNFSQERESLDTGFYFDRIWKIEIIRQAGDMIKKKIDMLLSSSGYEYKVVNNGLGSITFFQSTLLPAETKNKINKLASDSVKILDTYGICKDCKIVHFDTFQNLNENFGGNLLYYYK